MNNPPNKRLLSLDILRGITIAGMIMVNIPVRGDISMHRSAMPNG